jgi:hypothetical protein
MRGDPGPFGSKVLGDRPTHPPAGAGDQNNPSA